MPTEDTVPEIAPSEDAANPKNEKDKKEKPPEAKTFKQELLLWFFRSMLALVAGSVASGATYLVSCGVEDAKQKAAERAKVTETKYRQRQLQLDLLKQIIEVAKKADFKDPKSLYQLGLISIMVNENEAVFGVQLTSAEMVIQQMFMQLAPITGIKRRLAESVQLLSEIKTKLDAATTAENAALATVKEGYKKLNDPVTPWYKKKKIKEGVEAAEKILREQRLVKQFYLQQQEREQQNQEYFDDQLDVQERALKQALKNAELAQIQLKNNQDEFVELTKKLEKESPEARMLAEKLRITLKNLTRNSLQADYTIVKLKNELEIRNNELTTLRQVLYDLIEKYKKFAKACMKAAVSKTPAMGGGGGGGVGIGGGGGFGSLRKTPSKAADKPAPRVVGMTPEPPPPMAASPTIIPRKAVPVDRKKLLEEFKRATGLNDPVSSTKGFYRVVKRKSSPGIKRRSVIQSYGPIPKR